MINIQYDVIYSDWFVYNIIESSSTPSILYNLKLTNKWHHKIITFSHIKFMVIKNIHRKLKEYLGFEYDKFLSIMDKDNISISGSFVLQCILDEYWSMADIDLYTYNDTSNIEQVFVDNEYDYSFKNFDGGYSQLFGIKKVVNCCTTNKINIQLILLDEYKNVIDYIKTTFDFNICKNIYSIKNGKDYLYIDNLLNIMNKTVSGGILGTAYKFTGRKLKYEERGFTFQNNVIGNHIYYNGNVIPIIILDTNTKQITLFNETVYMYDKCYAKYNFDDKHYVKIESLQKIQKYKCHILYNCPIRCLDNTIEHYHAKLMISYIGVKHSEIVYDCIVIENSDNEMLRLHNENFESNEIVMLPNSDFKLNDKYDMLFMDFKEFCKKKKI